MACKSIVKTLDFIKEGDIFTISPDYWDETAVKWKGPRNNGVVPITNVTITITVPDGVQYSSDNVNTIRGTFDSGTNV